jgi:hypothetical protein
MSQNFRCHVHESGGGAVRWRYAFAQTSNPAFAHARLAHRKMDVNEAVESLLKLGLTALKEGLRKVNDKIAARKDKFRVTGKDLELDPTSCPQPFKLELKPWR